MKLLSLLSDSQCIEVTRSNSRKNKVYNMDIQYAQSRVFTPSDFSFPSNGIKAEVTPNTQTTLIGTST